MPQFHTGLLAHSYPKMKRFPFKGKGWTLCAIDSDPTGNYQKLRNDPKLKKTVTFPKEIVVEAETEKAAWRANELLWNALILVHSGQFWMDISDIDGTLLAAEKVAENPMPPGRHILQVNGVEDACDVATKASFRRSAVYALARFHFSASLYSVPLVDLDPIFATEQFPKISRPLHQVQAASAVVNAYGVIEELGLEVRAGRDNPSCLDDGTWNPVIKEELEGRLRKAGVDFSDPINWQIRGPKTGLETEQPRQIQRTSTPSPWAQWPVRDRMVDLVDAIAHLSWLRSSVCSHRLKASRVRLLSAYDITNGQFLARRLILERLGVWKEFINRPID